MASIFSPSTKGRGFDGTGAEMPEVTTCTITYTPSAKPEILEKFRELAVDNKLPFITAQNAGKLWVTGNHRLKQHCTLNSEGIYYVDLNKDPPDEIITDKSIRLRVKAIYLKCAETCDNIELVKLLFNKFKALAPPAPSVDPNAPSVDPNGQIDQIEFDDNSLLTPEEEIADLLQRLEALLPQVDKKFKVKTKEDIDKMFDDVTSSLDNLTVNSGGSGGSGGSGSGKNLRFV